VLDGGRRDDHLGAVRAEHRDLLLAHLVGHDEDAPVALVRRCDREADAGVPRGRLDDRPAGPQPAVPLGGLDQREADAVLHGSARIEVLELRENRRAGLAAERLEADDRGVADEVEHGRVLAAHRLPRVLHTHPAPALCSRPRFGGDPHGLRQVIHNFHSVSLPVCLAQTRMDSGFAAVHAVASLENLVTR
jgi:hypothetical protein